MSEFDSPYTGFVPDSFRVAGDEKETPEPSEPRPKKTKAELTPEQVEFQREVQGFIDSRKRLLASFAQDISLQFKMGTAFFIDLEKGEVNLDTRWFADKGFSKEQILWAMFHEVSHFRDLVEDNEAMMANFDYIRTQAKQTGAIMMQKWEEAIGAEHPDKLEKLKKQRPISKKHPHQTMNAVEQAAYKFHHTFYNVFDDINVNGRVAYNTSTYEPGTTGGDEVERLYAEKLFAKDDYTDLPRHLQFLYKLLREEMVPGQNVGINEEVKMALEQPIVWQGKKYTAKELVDKFIKPKKNRDTKAGSRYLVIRNTLEPIFQELLSKDLADWQPELPPENQQEQNQDGGQDESDDSESDESGGIGDPNPFADEYQDFADNSSPDQISDNEIEKFKDKHQTDKQAEAEAEEKRNASPEAKAQAAKAEQDAKWCEKNNVTPEILRQFQDIEVEIAPHLNELTRLWHQIIFGGSRESTSKVVGHFKTGTELDISHVISHSPGVVSESPAVALSAIERSRDMKRRMIETELVRKPELIRVRLVGDMSGSMDEKKRHILQQCFVLLLSSLREFNTELNLTRRQTKSKLQVDTEAWVFGDDAQKVKAMRASGQSRDEQVEIVEIFQHLHTTRGSTYDNVPLEKIAEEIPANERQRIAEQKILDIVFEVTDGGSSNAAASRIAVDTLSSIGMVTRAFQIGQVSPEETKIFNKVWNDGRSESRGEIIGSEIANLIPAIVETLKQYLSNIRL